jgi:hypothetical protein
VNLGAVSNVRLVFPVFLKTAKSSSRINAFDADRWPEEPLRPTLAF